MLARSQEYGSMVGISEEVLEEPREHEIHQTSHESRTKEIGALSLSVVLQAPHHFNDQVDVIEVPTRGFIERAMDTPHFPEWAKQQITDLLADGMLNPVRLQCILREAREDIDDLTELSERHDPDDLIDWDEIKQDFIGHGGTQA